MSPLTCRRGECLCIIFISHLDSFLFHKELNFVEISNIMSSARIKFHNKNLRISIVNIFCWHFYNNMSLSNGGQADYYSRLTWWRNFFRVWIELESKILESDDVEVSMLFRSRIKLEFVQSEPPANWPLSTIGSVHSQTHPRSGNLTNTPHLLHGNWYYSKRCGK